MSFHPRIVALTPFTPHAYENLMAMRALPVGAIPENVYAKMIREFNAVDDVNIERITYMHEGLKITGVVASPKAAAAKNTDIIIYNRGGSGNYGLLALHTILRQFIPLARAGYVVSGSNYRGNDGGDGKDEFGGRDVDDVVTLHDITRAHPLVNDKPCFVIGHSRGGMMTYLLMKRGFPMRAAIAIAAVSDLFGSETFRQELRENVHKRYIPDFETNENEALQSRSAIYWPEKLNAPLLLLHGTKDEAVPYEQSVALAAKLQALHATHELVTYENGNHSLVRHWSEVSAQILDWLRRYA